MRRHEQHDDAGVSLVEYALGIALIIVASLGAFQYLSNQASRQSQQQADCISTRPPPPSCVRTPVPATTTSTTIDPASTTTTLTPPSTDPPPTTTEPPRATVTPGAGVATRNPDNSWRIDAPITVTDPASAPVPGAVVTARVLLGTQPFVVQCTTDAAGTCTLTFGGTTAFDSIPATQATASMAVLSIQSTPGAVGPFPTYNFTRP
jgi:hypothetical protein